jgi:hypothetical protein
MTSNRTAGRTVHQVVSQTMYWDIDKAVAVDWAVWRAVSLTVSRSQFQSVSWDIDRDTAEGPTHAAFWDFRDAVDVGQAVDPAHANFLYADRGAP